MAPSGYQCLICGGAQWDKPETCAYSRYIKYVLKDEHNFTDEDLIEISNIIEQYPILQKTMQEWLSMDYLLKEKKPKRIIRELIKENVISLNKDQRKLILNFYQIIEDNDYQNDSVDNHGYQFQNGLPKFLHDFNCQGTQECYEKYITIGKKVNEIMIYTWGTYSFYGSTSIGFGPNDETGFRIDDQKFWPKAWGNHHNLSQFDEIYCRTCWNAKNIQQYIYEPEEFLEFINCDPGYIIGVTTSSINNEGNIMEEFTTGLLIKPHVGLEKAKEYENKIIDMFVDDEIPKENMKNLQIRLAFIGKPEKQTESCLIECNEHGSVHGLPVTVTDNILWSKEIN